MPQPTAHKIAPHKQQQKSNGPLVNPQTIGGGGEEMKGARKNATAPARLLSHQQVIGVVIGVAAINGAVMASHTLANTQAEESRSYGGRGR